LALHFPLKILGYLEFSEIYSLGLDRIPPPRQLDSSYTIDQANADDIDFICRELVRDEPPVVIRTLFAEGHHCFVARSQGRIVA